MIGWMLTFSPMRMDALPIIGDFSKITPSKQRARGRIGDTVVKVSEGTITLVKNVDAKKDGRLRSTLIYRLTLETEFKSKFHIFFSVNDSSELRKQRWLRSPGHSATYVGGLPKGVTSVQYTRVLPNGTHHQSPIFSEGFSIHLAFSQQTVNEVKGSLLLVFPDRNLSFVNGAFRAKLM